MNKYLHVSRFKSSICLRGSFGRLGEKTRWEARLKAFQIVVVRIGYWAWNYYERTPLRPY